MRRKSTKCRQLLILYVVLFIATLIIAIAFKMLSMLIYLAIFAALAIFECFALCKAIENEEKLDEVLNEMDEDKSSPFRGSASSRDDRRKQRAAYEKFMEDIDKEFYVPDEEYDDDSEDEG